VKKANKEDKFNSLIRSANWSDSSVVSKVFAPGRIEVLGKHTDYAGGDSVTCAVHLGIYFIASLRSDKEIHIHSEAFDETVVFDQKGKRFTGASHWMIYPEVVVKRIIGDFGSIDKGIDIQFLADLPHAAGMSSSSALITGLFLIMDDILELSETSIYKNNIPDLLHLGEYLGAVENGLNYGNFPRRKGVGTFGGSEDHVAVLCSKKDHIGHYSYLPTIAQAYADLGAHLTFVVAHSGVFAEKTGNALELYNRASTLSEEVQKLILAGDSELNTRTLGESLRTGKADLDTVFKFIRDHSDLSIANNLCDRYSQFYLENVEIIPAFMDALQRRDYSELGRQVDRSQLFATTLLKNQVDETVYLANEARQLGAIASSAFGGGFGGSVWSLIESDHSPAFMEKWKKSYEKKFPLRAKTAKFFLAQAENGAKVFELD